MRKPVAERLREWGAAKGLTQAEAARRLGMSAERYGNYVRGEREPDLQVLGLLFDKLGITPEWLFSDDDEVPISALPDLVPDIKGPLTPGILELDGVSYTALSRYDAALSAGPGSLLEAEPQPLGYHLIETQWLAAISRTAPESLSVVQVDGDSMETTFFHGDWVLVDSTQRRVSREGIYALRVGDSLWIKRLSLNLRRRLVNIISDNRQRYDPQDLPEDKVQLVGRVIALVARRVP